MQKLVIAVVFMLLANLVICFEAEGDRSSFTAHLSESDTEVARADQTCRKRFRTCNPPARCCPGYKCIRDGSGILRCQEPLF
uniref:Peptide toxin T-39 n=1 Tax=Araneus ventricosus TaxID=182803 RepID=K4K943_ARAVE|nr:peptide toxin T-39 [Araneus ventricosus]